MFSSIISVFRTAEPTTDPVPEVVQNDDPDSFEPVDAEDAMKIAQEEYNISPHATFVVPPDRTPLITESTRSVFVNLASKSSTLETQKQSNEHLRFLNQKTQEYTIPAEPAAKPVVVVEKAPEPAPTQSSLAQSILNPFVSMFWGAQAQADQPPTAPPSVEISAEVPVVDEVVPSPIVNPPPTEGPVIGGGPPPPAQGPPPPGPPPISGMKKSAPSTGGGGLLDGISGGMNKLKKTPKPAPAPEPESSPADDEKQKRLAELQNGKSRLKPREPREPPPEKPKEEPEAINFKLRSTGGPRPASEILTTNTTEGPMRASTIPRFTNAPPKIIKTESGRELPPGTKLALESTLASKDYTDLCDMFRKLKSRHPRQEEYLAFFKEYILPMRMTDKLKDNKWYWGLMVASDLPIHDFVDRLFLYHQFLIKNESKIPSQVSELIKIDLLFEDVERINQQIEVWKSMMEEKKAPLSPRELRSFSANLDGSSIDASVSQHREQREKEFNLVTGKVVTEEKPQEESNTQPDNTQPSIPHVEPISQPPKPQPSVPQTEPISQPPKPQPQESSPLIPQLDIPAKQDPKDEKSTPPQTSPRSSTHHIPSSNAKFVSFPGTAKPYMPQVNTNMPHYPTTPISYHTPSTTQEMYHQPQYIQPQLQQFQQPPYTPQTQYNQPLNTPGAFNYISPTQQYTTNGLLPYNNPFAQTQLTPQPSFPQTTPVEPEFKGYPKFDTTENYISQFTPPETQPVLVKPPTFPGHE